MLTILTYVILTLACAGVSAFCFYKYENAKTDFSELWAVISLICTAAGTAILVLCLVCQIWSIIGTQIDKEADRAMYRQRYISITYQLENAVYDGDDGYGNTDAGNMARRELYSDIEYWNKDLAQKKQYAHNPWKNWFYPADLYDEFEFIDYPGTVG